MFVRTRARNVEGVYFRRLSLDGRAVGGTQRLDVTPADLPAVQVSTTAIGPWDGMGAGGYVVAWSHRHADESIFRVSMTYLDPDGQQVGEPIEWNRSLSEGSVNNIQRMAVAGGGNGGIAVVFDSGTGHRVHYLYRGAIARAPFIHRELTADGWGASILNMGGERFVTAHSTFFSQRRPGGCTAENSGLGLYLTELDQGNQLRQARVFFGDGQDMPNLVRGPDGLIMFWQALVLGDRLIDVLGFDLQSWMGSAAMPTRIDRGEGTANPPQAAIVNPDDADLARMVVLWTDERAANRALYYRPFHREAGEWTPSQVDGLLLPELRLTQQPKISANQGIFGVVARQSDGPNMGIVFAAGAIHCHTAPAGDAREMADERAPRE